MNAVDTNVLIYAHDPRDARKQALAVSLIQSQADGVLDLTSRGGAANLSGIELWKLTETGANSD